MRIVRTQGEGFDDVWTYNGISGVDWSITDFSETSGVQTFTAVGDGGKDLEAFNFLGSGAATVEYYEYGSETPSFTKDITWSTPGTLPGQCNPIGD